MALEYGYALISASINSLAGQLPSWLRIALLRHRIWSPQRVLADVDRLPPGARPSELVRLAPHLPASEVDNALAEALHTARGIVNDGERAQALTELADGLSGEAREAALAEGLETARAIADADDRAGLS